MHHLLGYALIFIAGGVVGGLIFRNNGAKAKAALDRLVNAYDHDSEATKTFILAEIKKLKDDKATPTA